MGGSLACASVAALVLAMQVSAPQAQSAPEGSPEAAPKSAQEDIPSRRAIEEIVVTAQKTEQNLRDVPISMSVLGDEFLHQESIVDLQGLAQHVPNFRFSDTQFSSSVAIRGFSADVLNKGFEQPVGLVVDGVPFGRIGFFEAALFDLARVEVLRGPQGTLFGKNTEAGLVQLVPNKPTDAFTGGIDVELGELDRRRFEAAVGGPLIEKLVNFRVAALSDERDGILGNTTSAVVAGATERLGSRDRKGARMQLEFPDLFGGSLSLGYETSDSESGGYAFEFTKHVRQGARDFLRQYDPNADFNPGNFTGSQETPSLFRREIDRFVAHASYDVGAWGVHALADRSQLDVTDNFDGDRTPAPFSVARSSDENPQTTFEVRIDSPSLAGFFGLEWLSRLGLRNSKFTAGLFYQQRIIRDSEFFIAVDPLVIAAGMAARNDGVPVARPPDAEDETTTMFWEQDSNAIAGFSQAEWYFGDRWTLTYGMRLSHEEQSAEWERVLSPNSVVLRAGNFENFTADESRSEVAFTPKVSVVYDLTEGVNVFANRANGFRAGGFNEFASNAEGRRDFDSETGTAWEVGTKMVLLDGLARLDLGLYRQDVEDYQQLVESRGAVLTSVVVENAAEARSQGVEADYTVFPRNWLTVRGAFAFTDTEYIDFKNGPCEPDRRDTDGDGDPTCDLSGKPLPFAPRWTHSVTPTVHFPLTAVPGVDGAVGGLTVEYQDVHFVSPAIDFRERQTAFVRLNGHIGLENAEQGWSVRLVGENLTDEVITFFTNTSTVGPGNLVQATRAPRLLFAKFRWEF